MTHTPGPWENNKWNCDEHQISALGGTVALISHSHSLISDKSADANARLIAAAPDLLEACRDALNWRNTSGAIGASVEDKLRAAITLAEGA